MKRIKYLILTIFLIFTAGCRPEITEMVPIDDYIVENGDVQSDNTENDEPEDTVTDEEGTVSDAEEIPVENNTTEEEVYTAKDYSLVDHLGLSDETLELFGECAMYLWEDADVSKGDVFSSKSYRDIREFLFYLNHNRAEKIQGFEDSEHLLLKISRDDFTGLLSEVFNEQKPDKVIELLPTQPDGDWENIYYNAEDKCIYLEIGATGWNQFFYEISGVDKKQDEYVITYDVFSVFNSYEGPIETVNINIKEADNPYGYKFVSKKISPEYLFEKFINGVIDAEILYPSETDVEKSISISDLNVNHPDWTFMEYSVGDRLDLDNDGENELIIDGPYGGMYLDAIDGKLYVFAQATGNAGGLDYTFYDNAYWIVYKDTTHAGRLFYQLYRYEGGDNLKESIILSGEKYSEDEPGNYSFNGQSITEEEFLKIKEAVFNSNSDYSESEEELFKFVSYLLYLEDGMSGLPEDTISYEIVCNLGEKADNVSTDSDDYRMRTTSHKMLTSDLNNFLKDVLKSHLKYDAGYESISEAGIYCLDDGYTYAYNGAGWADYAVVKKVTRTDDSIEIEAVIMNDSEGLQVGEVKFSLKNADNKFGYTIEK